MVHVTNKSTGNVVPQADDEIEDGLTKSRMKKKS